METDPDQKRKPKPDRGVTRRRFLKTMGSGAALAAASDALPGLGSAKAEIIKPEAIVKVNLFVNGLRHRLAR